MKEGLDVEGVKGRRVKIKWKQGYEEGAIEGGEEGKLGVRYDDGERKVYKLWKKDIVLL